MVVVGSTGVIYASTQHNVMNVIRALEMNMIIKDTNIEALIMTVSLT